MKQISQITSSWGLRYALAKADELREKRYEKTIRIMGKKS